MKALFSFLFVIFVLLGFSKLAFEQERKGWWIHREYSHLVMTTSLIVTNSTILLSENKFLIQILYCSLQLSERTVLTKLQIKIASLTCSARWDLPEDPSRGGGGLIATAVAIGAVVRAPPAAHAVHAPVHVDDDLGRLPRDGALGDGGRRRREPPPRHRGRGRGGRGGRHLREGRTRWHGRRRQHRRRRRRQRLLLHNVHSYPTRQWAFLFYNLTYCGINIFAVVRVTCYVLKAHTNTSLYGMHTFVNHHLSLNTRSMFFKILYMHRNAKFKTIPHTGTTIAKPIAMISYVSKTQDWGKYVIALFSFYLMLCFVAREF